MKKFKVTLMIPQERVLDAPDIQDAHNQVAVMMKNYNLNENPGPKVHSILEVVEAQILDFGPSPAA
jgi:hypothetical protein